MMEVLPYTPGDLSLVMKGQEPPFKRWLEAMESTATCHTFLVNGELMMVAGFVTVWDGVAESFAVVDQEKAKGYGKLLTDGLRSMTDIYLASGYHRFQATCGAKDSVNKAFLRASGYSIESVMRRGAFDGTDLVMFTRILEAQNG